MRRDLTLDYAKISLEISKTNAIELTLFDWGKIATENLKTHPKRGKFATTAISCAFFTKNFLKNKSGPPLLRIERSVPRMFRTPAERIPIEFG